MTKNEQLWILFREVQLFGDRLLKGEPMNSQLDGERLRLLAAEGFALIHEENPEVKA